MRLVLYRYRKLPTYFSDEPKRKTALNVGGASILLALCIQLFNDFACYKRELLDAVANIWFPAIVLLPAFLAIFSANPLKAVGASVVAALFYLFAYYIDCVRPYEGGGASMAYVVVIMYGLPLAFLASWMVGKGCDEAGVIIEKRQ